MAASDWKKLLLSSIVDSGIDCTPYLSCSLAKFDITDVPRKLVQRMAAVETLDLSGNDIQSLNWFVYWTILDFFFFVFFSGFFALLLC